MFLVRVTMNDIVAKFSSCTKMKNENFFKTNSKCAELFYISFLPLIIADMHYFFCLPAAEQRYLHRAF